MRKVIKIPAVILGAIAGLLVLSIAVSCIFFPPVYIYRCIVNLEGKTTDYLFFPDRRITASDTPCRYQYAIDGSFNGMSIQYTVKGALKTAPLDELAADNETTSLIVIHDDQVVYEEYFNGATAESTNTSFSVAKSIDSLLVGMAIDEGLIESETQPIAEFIPEFEGTEFAGITIEQLLRMRSPIEYWEGWFWLGHNARTYYYPDLRDLALNRMRVDEDYNGEFLYNNYHPLLLGIILERVTGMSVSEYFRRKIWGPVGAEYDASWSLDSEDGFEKMESGINFRSLDFIKIGSMLLHRGRWNGQTVISEEWLDRSLIDTTLADYPGGIGYRYMWYSVANDGGGYDFFGHGNRGQYLYISPENDTVILRTGTGEGRIDMWMAVLYQMAACAGRE